MKTRKAIAYCRISTRGQEKNTSLEDQEEKIAAFAKSQDIEIIATFKDIATATNLKRSGYLDAIEFMENNQVDCFMVAKFDRAHRNQLNMLSFEKTLRDKGVAFISVNELIDTSAPSGQLMFQILGSFSEFECNRIRERTRSGRKRKLAQNKSVGGRVPLGYDTEYNIIDEEVEIVRELFWLYNEKKSLGRVKEIANSRGYKGKNNKVFSRQSIHIIITNRFYLGEYHCDGTKENNNKVIKDHHKAIVSKILFGKVQKILNSNKRG